MPEKKSHTRKPRHTWYCQYTKEPGQRVVCIYVEATTEIGARKRTVKELGLTEPFDSPKIKTQLWRGVDYKGETYA